MQLIWRNYHNLICSSGISTLITNRLFCKMCFRFGSFSLSFNFKLTEKVLLFYQYFTTKQITKINKNILLRNKQALICLNIIASLLSLFFFPLFHLAFDKLITSYKHKHKRNRKNKTESKITTAILILCFQLGFKSPERKLAKVPFLKYSYTSNRCSPSSQNPNKRTRFL